METKDIFHSPTQGKMDLAKTVKEIHAYLNQDAQSRYKLVVGTDSEGNSRADFVTAIIVHRVGHGGRFFWKRTKNGHKIYHTLRDRIYQEVVLSLETAQSMLVQLQQLLGSNNEPNYDFQIHIDVGKNGPTREMIKEVVGMVRGNGFKAKIKPYSFAASNIADRYV